MRYSLPVKLSVAIITHNEEANLARTLESVASLVSSGKGEIIVVDSGSTDRTVEIARAHGAKVFPEEWKGYAGQKNSAIEKAAGNWILSLDADEELDQPLQNQIEQILIRADEIDTQAFFLRRKNHFLGRWIKHGGFWPDTKLRLFRRGVASFENRPVHETLQTSGTTAEIRTGAVVHHCYPTISDYIAHMNRYSSLGAEAAVAAGRRGSAIDITIRPLLTFLYNYVFRLGFLDGRKGLLLHINHAVYVSWKYAKVWELANVKLKSNVSSAP